MFEELIDEFKNDVVDLISDLEQAILILEKEKTNAEKIDVVFRAMHSLKGASAMFGFDSIGGITHIAEDVYDLIRDEKLLLTDDILNVTISVIDHISNLLDDPNIEDEKNAEEHKMLVSSLKAFLDTEKSPESIDEIPSEQEHIEPDPKEAEDSEPQLYYIYFKPREDFLQVGGRPEHILDDIAQLGQTINWCFTGNVPNDETYDPTISYLLWHILLTSHKTKEEILADFILLDPLDVVEVKTVENKHSVDEEVLQFFEENIDQEDVITLPNFSEKNIETIIESPVEITNKTVKRNDHVTISSLRVSSAKIDSLLNFVSELITKQAQLSMLVEESDDPRLTEVAEGIEMILGNLRENAFSISLVALEKSVLRFERLVRDVSSKLNKKVNFSVEGKETELDKTIVEKIIDPLMHILRNSLDHGIELPEERLKQGKPAEGNILLKAYPSGAQVIIKIIDDGGGINFERVKEKAIAKGLLDKDYNPTDKELINFILTPGFSTAENISEVSGRGVGMDVVNQKIEEVHGELDIESKFCSGTTITIRLPLTISIIDSLLIKIDSSLFLIPLSIIDSCYEIDNEELQHMERNFLMMNEDVIPLVNLRKEFDINENIPEFHKIITVKHKEQTIGLVADSIIGKHQAVLKPLGNIYKQYDMFSGVSILGDGDVALVLDTNKVISHYNQKNILKHAQ